MGFKAEINHYVPVPCYFIWTFAYKATSIRYTSTAPLTWITCTGFAFFCRNFTMFSCMARLAETPLKVQINTETRIEYGETDLQRRNFKSHSPH